ncbi:glycosyltransferase [Patescibacteria group bacterium]|nr:glycosyltransferase [Patescibacteria group bacterium]
MDLSVLIVNWNTKDLLKESLESIFAYTREIDFEVIVFDNGSTDGSIEMVKSEFPDVVLIESPENKGFVVGNLEGYKKSTGKYVVMFNSDAYLKSDAFSTMVSYLEKHSNVGILGPKLLYPNGDLQESCRRFPDFTSQAMILLKLHNLFPHFGPISRYYMRNFSYDKTSEVDQVMGACLVTRRSIIEDIGFLDDTFWAWFEEVDYCKRVKDRGYINIFYPGIAVYHHKGQSFKNLTKRQRLFNTSMRYYFKKHKPYIQYLGITALWPVSMILSYLTQLIVYVFPVKKDKNL